MYVVNISYFQSCHFSDIKSFAQLRVVQTSHRGIMAAHSVEDHLALHMLPLGARFAHQKLANPMRVNLPRQIEVHANLTPFTYAHSLNFSKSFLL